MLFPCAPKPFARPLEEVLLSFIREVDASDKLSGTDICSMVSGTRPAIATTFRYLFRIASLQGLLGWYDISDNDVHLRYGDKSEHELEGRGENYIAAEDKWMEGAENSADERYQTEDRMF